MKPASLFTLTIGIAIGFAHAAPARAELPQAASVCMSCHGANGEGGAGVPRLAGQDTGYVANALAMFKAGTRASPVMQPIAARLDAEEIERLATYFSQLQPRFTPPVLAAPPELIAQGERLARVGAPNADACFSCHGDEGRGTGVRFPGIVGQPSQFLVDRLHEFQQRARDGAAKPGTMTAVAAKLDEAQIAAAAAYLSRLAP
jgi:cytochrome c553